jgi:hypothetical protein
MIFEYNRDNFFCFLLMSITHVTLIMFAYPSRASMKLPSSHLNEPLRLHHRHVNGHSVLVTGIHDMGFHEFYL